MSANGSEDVAGGIAAAWRRLMGVGGAVLQGRLELAGIEFEEEVRRWSGIAILGAVAAVFALLTLAGLSALLVILSWSRIGPWQVLTILCVAYAAIAAYCVSRLRAAIRNAPPPFAATRAEFEKDRAAWRARS